MEESRRCQDCIFRRTYECKKFVHPNKNCPHCKPIDKWDALCFPHRGHESYEIILPEPEVSFGELLQCSKCKGYFCPLHWTEKGKEDHTMCADCGTPV